MPVKESIDVARNLIYRELQGRVSPEEIIASIDSVVNDPDFDPGMNSLNDLRQVVHQADREFVMNIAHTIVGYSEKLKSGKVALVVSSDVVFGMMRMLQSYVGDAPLDIMVFKDIEEAEYWLES